MQCLYNHMAHNRDSCILESTILLIISIKYMRLAIGIPGLQKVLKPVGFIIYYSYYMVILFYQGIMGLTYIFL
jgi:hypothetical protein